MRGVATRALCVSAVLLVVMIPGRAQEPPASVAASPDPRVGLKGGFRDAGQAARNMELVSSLPRPEGFFDPKAPAGTPTPPEKPENTATPAADATAPTAPDPGAPAAITQPATAPAPTLVTSGAEPTATPATPATSDQPAATSATPATPGAPVLAAPPSPPSPALNFANSDLAFRGTHLFVGNFHGFNSYDIERATRPRLLASVVCPGGQGDVSVHGNLLFMSVEQTRGRLDCGTGGVEAPVSAERFRGIRIFDITDLRKPRQVAAVQTCRGSHTHTLVPDPTDPNTLYVYGSGTSTVRAGEELEGCSGGEPDADPNTALFSIDVIKVPLAAPEQAAIVNRPRIFADPASGAIAGLEKGGDRGPGAQAARATNQCHDITVFPEIGLAAGACSGNGILLDIADPVHPVRLDAASDRNFAYWHSATFNNDGTKVIFTDEWGGGTRPRCRATDLPNWGADAIFDIVDRRLQFRGYYKMPAPQTDQENCVAHNGSLVPVPGRDIMVQAWYQGGVSVFDFTDSAHPFEIAFFDRGPIDEAELVTGGYWSAYWYNGNIYATEIARGLDVFRLAPSEHLSRHEIDAAIQARSSGLNAQQQARVTWPATTVVARAYVDQLARRQVLPPARIRAVRAALDRSDDLRSGKEKGAAAVLDQLDALAAQLERDAGTADAGDATRLRALATTIRGRTARLR